jgi:hypothetical protein
MRELDGVAVIVRALSVAQLRLAYPNDELAAT